MKKLFFIIILLISTAKVTAQTDSTLNKPLKFILEGTITDVDDNLPIENATVRLIGTDSSDIETRTDSLGFYEFKLNQNVNYTIIVSSDGFLNSRGQETTTNMHISTMRVHDFKLQKIKKCVMPFPLVVFTENSYEAFPNSEQNIPSDSLAFIIRTLVINPTIILNIIGHCSTTEKSNISKKRAKWVKKYLITEGIEKDRLKITDGGVLENRKYDQIVLFAVIADNYKTK